MHIELALWVYEAGYKLGSTIIRSPRFVVWTWDVIKQFGEAKSLKWSYAFLFIVPVLAHVLQTLPESVTVPIWNKTFEIRISLPFSWIVLFFSAFFASLGNVIYSMACPELVTRYADFPSFNAAARDGTYLRPVVRRLSTKHDNTLSQQLDRLRIRYSDVDIPFNLEVMQYELHGKKELTSSCFYFVRDAANLATPLLRLLASIFYFLAFVCLAVIAIQNVRYVATYLSS